MKSTKFIWKSIYGAAFILLLHIFRMVYAWLTHVICPAQVWVMPKSENAAFNFQDIYQLEHIKMIIFHRIVQLAISFVALGGVIYIHKRTKKPFYLFICAAGSLFVLFVTTIMIWDYFTVNFCLETAYAITYSRFIDITISVIVILLSLVPIFHLSKIYDQEQRLIVFVFLILYLYLYSIFHASYYKLFLNF
jgi:hypothetical protein